MFVFGRRVIEIEDLSDGENYVCVGFEGFKIIKYGKVELEFWFVGMQNFCLLEVYFGVIYYVEELEFY